MLKLYDQNYIRNLSEEMRFNFPGTLALTEKAALYKATEIKLSREINGEFNLTFTHPRDDTALLIAEGDIVTCYEATVHNIDMIQSFRVMKVSRRDTKTIEVNCMNVYNADAPKIHIQNQPLACGVFPWQIINSGCTNYTNSCIKQWDNTTSTSSSINKDSRWFHSFRDLHRASSGATNYFGEFRVYEPDSSWTYYGAVALPSEFGLTWCGYTGNITSGGYENNLRIDLDSIDKTSPYDVMLEVIKACGKGEIFINGFNLALVEKLGEARGQIIDLSNSLTDVTIDRDFSNVVTRLYPYGTNDLDISTYDTSTDHDYYTAKSQFLDSPNQSLYGVREGFKDYEISVDSYSEKSDAVKALYKRGCWEFDADNAERIDVPDVSITGDWVDLSYLDGYGADYRLNIGDTVSVRDGATTYTGLRVTKKEWYPYELGRAASITFGHVKKDLFFYLNQLGVFARRYGKISTSSGKINGRYIKGNLGYDVDSNLNFNSSDTKKSESQIISKIRVGDAEIKIQNGVMTVVQV